jgi:phosphoenolpyruvate---glycerone phosphotransferase subunit DhaK
MFELALLPKLFSLFRARFESEHDYLNDLDGTVGDGDHGSTMLRAFRAAESATQTQFDDLGAGFDAAAAALAENAGGAIGPLLAALFAEGGVVFAEKERAGSKEFAEFLRGGLQAIQDVGGAKVGDKTLVDALDPAAQALEQNQAQPLPAALEVAIDAAQKGAESTSEMVAAHGRAQFVAERSRGYQDAGATSMVILLETMLHLINGQRAEPGLAQPDIEYSPPPGKLINHPDDLVQQDNQGLALAYPDLVRLTPAGVLLRARPKEMGKAALAIGHGGGHTPSMGGFVGPGLLDADIYGPLFTCASGVRIAQAIEQADRGAGVALLVSNHAGDVLNARLALRRAQQSGIQVVPVYLGDDIATAPRAEYQKRRGLGGLLFTLKIGGAAAEAGSPLAEVTRLMEKSNQRTATLAVAVRAPEHPATGQVLFELPKGEIEIGTGVHGEMGVYRGPYLPADQIVDMLVERLVTDLEAFAGRKMLVFINGAGGTSKMELHILYRRAHQALTQRGYEVAAGVVDAFFTTLDMGGFSLSLCAVDDELLKYWQMPASGPAFRWPYC